MKGKAHSSLFAAFSDSKKRYQFNAGLTGRVLLSRVGPSQDSNSRLSVL